MEHWCEKLKSAGKLKLLILAFLQGKDISNGIHDFCHLISKFNTGIFKRRAFKYPLSYYTIKNKTRIFWAVVTESVVRRYLINKMFLQNSQESTCYGVQLQKFSLEFCGTFQNSLSLEYQGTVTSVVFVKTD